MDLKTILMGVQTVLSILLVVSIMPQNSKNAVPTQFGTESSQTYFKPKGKEAFLARMTKILGVLFFINAIIMLLIK